MTRIMVAVAVVLVGGFLDQAAPGAVIDFESTPAGGLPVDDAFLSAPYNLAGGGTVSFYFDVNKNLSFDPGVDQRPVFEAYGPDPNSGFFNNATSDDDTANGGLAGQLGSYFLRQLQPGSPPPPFIVDYNLAVGISALSGEIWDIDGTLALSEGWQVDALDSSNTLISSLFSPPGIDSTLDGLPWVFAFSGLPANFDKLRITFVGSKTMGLGLAFNNFNPTAVPEPGSVVLAALGCVALLAYAHNRRRPATRRYA